MDDHAAPFLFYMESGFLIAAVMIRIIFAI